MNWEQGFVEVNRLYTHLCYPFDQQVSWIQLSNAVSGVSLIVYVGHFGCFCCLHSEHWLCPSLFIIIDDIKDRKRWLFHRSNGLFGNVFRCGWEKWFQFFRLRHWQLIVTRDFRYVSKVSVVTNVSKHEMNINTFSLAIFRIFLKLETSLHFTKQWLHIQHGTLWVMECMFTLPSGKMRRMLAILHVHRSVWHACCMSTWCEW